AERATAERARARKEQREKAQALVQGKTLNRAEADLLRHFEYGGKIRRVHVDAAQLRALNAGELGVIQLDGRYWLVERALAESVREVAPQHVALLPDPGAGDDADEFGVLPDPA
ncbi:nucleoprotein/polynucleotide-associated enzyme, partial [mine drainage metagenome]